MASLSRVLSAPPTWQWGKDSAPTLFLSQSHWAAGRPANTQGRWPTGAIQNAGAHEPLPP